MQFELTVKMGTCTWYFLHLLWVILVYSKNGRDFVPTQNQFCGRV